MDGFSFQEKETMACDEQWHIDSFDVLDKQVSDEDFYIDIIFKTDYKLENNVPNIPKEKKGSSTLMFTVITLQR